MKKNSILFVLALLIILSTNAQTKVLASDFEKEFKNGFLAVKRGNYWGFVDTLGNEVSPFTDEGVNGKPSVNMFTKNRYVSFNSKENKTSLYGEGGKLITNKYTDIFGFHDTISLALEIKPKIKSKSFNTVFAKYIKLDGKEAFLLPQATSELIYNRSNAEEFVGNFYEGLAYVSIKQKNSSSFPKFGFINKSGKLVIPANYKEVSNFSEGRAIVKGIGKYGEEQWGVIDKTGKTIKEFIYSKQPSDYENGMSIIQNANRLYGFMDASGNVIIEPKYLFASSFFNEHAIVKEGEFPSDCIIKVIDKLGKTIKKIAVNEEYSFPEYYECKGNNFSDSLVVCSAIKIDGKLNRYYGALDSKANEVVPFKFEYLEKFSSGRAYAKKDNKEGFIDTKGNWIIEMIKPEY